MNKHKRVFITCVYLVIVASIVSHAHQDKDIASLIQQLEHADVDVRNSARGSLKELGNAPVPALIEALNYENAVVRKEVVRILHDMWFNNRRIILELSELKSLDANMNDTPRNEDIVSRNEDITRALVKALKDDDYEVRSEAVNHFLLRSKASSKGLAPEVVSGLVHSLCYGSPFFSESNPGEDWGDMRYMARIAHALHLHSDVLYSSSWQIRFGASIAYGYGICRGAVFMKELPHPSRTIKAIISTLAEGLTHPDWKTQEDAIKVLNCLRINYYHLFDDRARQAFEGLPPFGIVFQTIEDGYYVEDPDLLDSLNTDGITFKFNRSIRESGTIKIQAVNGIPLSWNGEPLGWNIEKSSHSVTITPPEGKDLVNRQEYRIQLRDFKDVLRYHQLGADIEFSISVPPHRRTH